MCSGRRVSPERFRAHRWMQTVSSFIHEGVPLHEARCFLKVLDSSRFVRLVFLLDPLAHLDCISFPFSPPRHRSPHAFPPTFLPPPLTCRCRSTTRYELALLIAAKFDIAYVLQCCTCPLAVCPPVRSFVWLIDLTAIAWRGRLPLDLAIGLIVWTWKQSDRRSTPSSVEVRGGGGGEEEEEEERNHVSCGSRVGIWCQVLFRSMSCYFGWISVTLDGVTFPWAWGYPCRPYAHMMECERAENRVCNLAY